MWEAFDGLGPRTGRAAAARPRVHPHVDGPQPLHVPAVADYTDRRPLDETWLRLDSTRPADGRGLRAAAGAGERPSGAALIYLSLGSLGSADVDLMRRLVAVLADTPHRYIVSKGPQHAAYELAPNMWGAEFLPQTSIIPLVDLVITHGGNNTTTEAFHFGKPMVVLPLFWDQYDNAQRVEETGFGRRLATYAFEDDELRGAIKGLLGNGELRTRMAGIGAEIRDRDGVARAAAAIEAVGLAGALSGSAVAAGPALRVVKATRYVTAFREGGSLPGLVEADDDGLYVVKFRGAGQGPRVLVAEWLAGEIARALGLLVPELVAVDLAQAIADPEPDPEIHDLLVASVGRNIGLDFLPGALTFNPAIDRVTDPDWAAAVVWLDGLITNPDRSPRNPNLLIWHGRTWLIDHGASLYIHHTWRDPAAHARRAHAERLADHVLLPFASSIAGRMNGWRRSSRRASWRGSWRLSRTSGSRRTASPVRRRTSAARTSTT